MHYTQKEKSLLEKVNAIGIEIDALPEKNILFVVLSPYLDQLMGLLKQLTPTEMSQLFFQYEGVMKVLRMIEDEAQLMETALELN